MSALSRQVIAELTAEESAKRREQVIALQMEIGRLVGVLKKSRKTAEIAESGSSAESACMKVVDQITNALTQYDKS